MRSTHTAAQAGLEWTAFTDGMGHLRAHSEDNLQTAGSSYREASDTTATAETEELETERVL